MEEVHIMQTSSQPLVPTYKMGFFGATSYVIGNIIGSGIFITPSTIIRYTESAGLSLIIWLFCAFIAFLGRFF